MSVTITTDVFCDGLDGPGSCAQWVFGATGTKPRPVVARERAAASGWKRTRLVAKGPLVDLCPECASRRAVALARRLVDGAS